MLNDQVIDIILSLESPAVREEYDHAWQEEFKKAVDFSTSFAVQTLVGECFPHVDVMHLSISVSVISLYVHCHCHFILN